MVFKGGKWFVCFLGIYELLRLSLNIPRYDLRPLQTRSITNNCSKLLRGI
jgi:hypothetical protein